MRVGFFILLLLLITRPVPGLCAEKNWYRAPRLAIMTGFLKDPQKPRTVLEWREGLGSRFDADGWVRGFREAGATYLIFYDKWHDGFVNHDTKTTNYKTHRDFVGEIAGACQRIGLRLVLYFNAHFDGNPDFKRWAVRNVKGSPILFSERWPFESQSLHSPFRRIAVEQVRELLTNYGRIDGLWFDIFSQRLNTRNKWVVEAYEKMYRAPFDKAPAASRYEFMLRTLAGYLDEVRAIADRHQPDCVFTANGAAKRFAMGGPWTKWVGARLAYGSSEGHSFDRIGRLARMAWASPKPMEIGTLLSSTWFTPNEDEPPPARTTPQGAIAEAASAVCRGASVYMALCPGHAGTFGDDLKAAKAVGAWFGKIEPLLDKAQPYADVGIVLGRPAAEGPGLPARNMLWKRFGAAQVSAWDEVVAISENLERAGVFPEVLCRWNSGGNWPTSLGRLRAIVVPEVAVLDEKCIEQLRRYVLEGGRLVAFGHAFLVDAFGARRKALPLGDVFGVEDKGEVTFPSEAFPATVSVDSVYRGQFAGGNLIDGKPTFWASADTPMPHWAQINLPAQVEVAKVELVSRQGAYLVTDIDVEAYDGKRWELVKSVRNAASRVVSVPFGDPVRTQHIRVKVLRELQDKRDRQLADVEAIRVLDAAGRNFATDQGRRFTLVEATPELARTFDVKAVSFGPMAVQVEPTKAEVMARIDMDSRPPVILRNRFDKGEAILITTGEASVRHDAEFWSGLARLIVGKPTLLCSPADGGTDRYSVILTRVGETHVLHAIDRNACGPEYKPAVITISLDTERLGGAQEATLVSGGAPRDVKREGALLTFVLQPDPVASVTIR